MDLDALLRAAVERSASDIHLEPDAPPILAAMIDHINRDRHDHVITIEDPIEFAHDDVNCVISEREIPDDFDLEVRGIFSPGELTFEAAAPESAAAERPVAPPSAGRAFRRS
jgi:Tfp pilus assembly pilus retraction ATPase PilT